MTVDPENCGTPGCEFTVYGQRQGCLRAIDYGFREALILFSCRPNPVCRWHGNAASWVLAYSQMIGAQYQAVDVSNFSELPELPGFVFNPQAYHCAPKPLAVTLERE
jgi:hypothetical protein